MITPDGSCPEIGRFALTIRLEQLAGRVTCYTVSAGPVRTADGRQAQRRHGRAAGTVVAPGMAGPAWGPATLETISRDRLTTGQIGVIVGNRTGQPRQGLARGTCRVPARFPAASDIRDELFRKFREPPFWDGLLLNDLRRRPHVGPRSSTRALRVAPEAADYGSRAAKSLGTVDLMSSHSPSLTWGLRARSTVRTSGSVPPSTV